MTQASKHNKSHLSDARSTRTLVLKRYVKMELIRGF